MHGVVGQFIWDAFGDTAADVVELVRSIWNRDVKGTGLSGGAILLPGVSAGGLKRITGHADELAQASRKVKAVNLPSWRKIGIDMDEVLSGHTVSGDRAVQSGIKDLFPDSMNPSQIEKAIRQAYRHGEKILTQGDRVKMRGPFGDTGGVVEMWVNTETKIIETAYPKF
jgi:hypothetical protein